MSVSKLKKSALQHNWLVGKHTGVLEKTNWEWEHLKTLPLAQAQHPPRPPQADLPKSQL